jgi:tetratricopeptide (TPR) repeat protein
MNSLNQTNAFISSQKKNDEDLLFELIFSTLAENIAKLHIEELEEGNSNFQSKENQIEHRRNQVLEELKETTFQSIDSIQNGFEVLGKLLPQSISKDSFERINREVRVAISKIAQMGGIIQTSESNNDIIQDTLGFSKETINDFYSIAFDLFKLQEYKEASQIFDILTFLNPLSYDNWFARGISLSKIPKHLEALSAFAMATLLKPQSPDPRIYVIDSYLALNRPEDAEKEFSEVIKIIQSNDDKNAWQNWINLVQPQFAKK